MAYENKKFDQESRYPIIGSKKNHFMWLQLIFNISNIKKILGIAMYPLLKYIVLFAPLFLFNATTCLKLLYIIHYVLRIVLVKYIHLVYGYTILYYINKT